MLSKTIHRSTISSESQWIWHNIRVMNETTVSCLIGRWASAWEKGSWKVGCWKCNFVCSGIFRTTDWKKGLSYFSDFMELSSAL